MTTISNPPEYIINLRTEKMKRNKLKFIAGEYKPDLSYEHVMNKLLEEKKITKEQYLTDMSINMRDRIGNHVIEEHGEINDAMLDLNFVTTGPTIDG